MIPYKIKSFQEWELINQWLKILGFNQLFDIVYTEEQINYFLESSHHTLSLIYNIYQKSYDLTFRDENTTQNFPTFDQLKVDICTDCLLR